MSDPTIVHDEPPRAGVTILYLGPVAPHWDLRPDFGDRAIIDAFWDRIQARLMLLPPHDPQFRRNRERVKKDGARENITVAWDPPELDEDLPPRPREETARQ